jgi:hypothetical protein
MKDTPAFPHTIEMTLRDYFAAKALQGLLSESYDFSDRNRIAVKAYDFADAMLKAREQ